ncbi:MAG: hypothetical protein KDD60_04330 [Bdellovibrionales bacterium]|nr:hypothetical protein [Bdellovibrionales bacterium]
MADRSREFRLIALPDMVGLPEGIRETLIHEGFSTEVCSTIEELEKRVCEFEYPIIVANCGSNEVEAIAFAKSLIQTTSLHTFPLFIAGAEAESFEPTIEKYFPIVAALNTPFKRNQMVRAIHYLVERYPLKERQKQRAKAKKKAEAARIAAMSPLEKELPVALTEVHVPTLVFTQISQLPDGDYGGRDLKTKITMNKLEELGLVPTKPTLKQEVDLIQGRLDNWTGDHIRRTTLISDKFQNALGVPEDLRLAAAHAMLLLPSGFTSQNLGLLRSNYLMTSEAERHELASKMKDSALYLLGDLKEEVIPKIVTYGARHITLEELPDESTEQLSASLLTAAELIDRVCFQNGFWNPSAAYFLIHATTDGRLNFLHPLATGCMMKFLCEALAELPNTLSMSSCMQGDPELVKKAQENEAYIPKGGERKVPIGLLQPGMKLCRPIYSFDGERILDGNLLLDQDLIWRLWRLSAIRPMNTPLVEDQDIL